MVGIIKTSKTAFHKQRPIPRMPTHTCYQHHKQKRKSRREDTEKWENNMRTDCPACSCIHSNDNSFHFCMLISPPQLFNSVYPDDGETTPKRWKITELLSSPWNILTLLSAGGNTWHILPSHNVFMPPIESKGPATIRWASSRTQENQPLNPLDI